MLENTKDRNEQCHYKAAPNLCLWCKLILMLLFLGARGLSKTELFIDILTCDSRKNTAPYNVFCEKCFLF